jgi:hypothetical protein
MSAFGTVYGVANGTEVGSVIFIDSIISNTPLELRLQGLAAHTHRSRQV